MLSSQALLNLGSNIEAKLESGDTSLIFASIHGHLDVVEVSSPSFLLYSVFSSNEVFGAGGCRISTAAIF